MCPCSLHSPAEGHWLGSRKALDCQRHTALDQTPVKRTVLCPLLGPRSRSSVRTQQLVGCEGVSSPVREGAGRPRAHSAHRVTRVDPLGIHSEGVGGASPVITSLARQGQGSHPGQEINSTAKPSCRMAGSRGAEVCGLGVAVFTQCPDRCPKGAQCPPSVRAAEGSPVHSTRVVALGHRSAEMTWAPPRLPQPANRTPGGFLLRSPCSWAIALPRMCHQTRNEPWRGLSHPHPLRLDQHRSQESFHVAGGPPGPRETEMRWIPRVQRQMSPSRWLPPTSHCFPDSRSQC